MSLFYRPRAHTKRVANISGPVFDGDIPNRTATVKGTVRVTNDSALRHSAVFAACRLRADLISTFPCDIYTKNGNVDQLLPSKPKVLVSPGGDRWDYLQWMWATQFDLDRAGNAIGIITERNAFGLPARIDLQALDSVSVRYTKVKGLHYRIENKEYMPESVWHERQYTVAGIHVGLSPIAYAAYSIGEFLSMQEFCLDWFGNSGVPKAHLRNTARKLDTKEARMMKDRYKATQLHGDLFVTGSDWDYNPLQSQQAGMEWLEGKKFGLSDVARFFGVPVDLIEAAIAGSGTLTYQNVSQRNLQFLIMNLGPPVIRREVELSKLLGRGTFVKLNTDALLRMDTQGRADYLQTMIEARLMTNTEAREKDNREKLTDDQIAEFTKIYGPPKAPPTAANPSKPKEPVA